MRLHNSQMAQEFKNTLPATVSMTRVGDYEYYGSLENSLTHTEDVQTGYEVGDLALLTPGYLFAVYFDTPEEPPEGLMILGKITSDISTLNQMERSINMKIELNN